MKWWISGINGWMFSLQLFRHHVLGQQLDCQRRLSAPKYQRFYCHRMFSNESLAYDCYWTHVRPIEFQPVAKPPALIQTVRCMFDDAIQPKITGKKMKNKTFLVKWFERHESGWIFDQSTWWRLRIIFILHTRLQTTRYGNCHASMHANTFAPMNRTVDSNAVRPHRFAPFCISSRFQPMIRDGTANPYSDDKSGTFDLFYWAICRSSFCSSSMNHSNARYRSLRPIWPFVCHFDFDATNRNPLFHLINQPNWKEMWN